MKTPSYNWFQKLVVLQMLNFELIRIGNPKYIL